MSDFWPASTLGYKPKIPFWTQQQLESFERSLFQAKYAYWMEPRTGKSKPCVDTACYHYEHKESPLHITGVLVIAWPNGVHRGWLSDAFPENVPERIEWKGFAWDAGRGNAAKKTVSISGYEQRFNDLLKFPGLAVFAVNTESLVSDECKKYIGKFLKARQRVMVIGDESSSFSEPNARRNKTMQAIGKRPEAIIKRVLDGTPADKAGPLDFYTQIKFLSPRIFGYDNYSEYKAHFAEVEEQGTWEWREEKKKALNAHMNEGRPLEIAMLLAERDANRAGKGKHWPGIAQDEAGNPKFRNMGEFWNRMDSISYRATFAECFPDAAKPVFAKRHFELTVQQRKVYDQLRDEFRAEIDGQEVNAAHQLTRILRLQQIASNYYPNAKSAELHQPCDGVGCADCEDGIVYFEAPPVEIDPGRCPRLAALREELKDGKPTIVWTRFRYDAEQCFQLGKELDLKPVRYDGSVTSDQKEFAKNAFQRGDSNLFVANAQSAGRGIPLYRADKHIFFSNTFSFRTRKQAEDRAEHGAKKYATQVIDLIANDTVDDHLIIPALRHHMDIATWILRDKKREWI